MSTDFVEGALAPLDLEVGDQVSVVVDGLRRWETVEAVQALPCGRRIIRFEGPRSEAVAADGTPYSVPTGRELLVRSGAGCVLRFLAQVRRAVR
ncbi:MAG: hypothetical protein AAGA99_11645 [Actinomycetota bacterium]